MGFYTDYKAIFDAVKTALVFVPAVAEVPAVPAHDEEPEIPAIPAIPAKGVASIKTVLVGEQYTYGNLPKAIISAEPSPINPLSMGKMLNVSVVFSIILVIREYEPKDWFEEIIKPMGDVVDAILADRSLGKKVKDCYPIGFAPGEIKFEKTRSYSAGLYVFRRCVVLKQNASMFLKLLVNLPVRFLDRFLKFPRKEDISKQKCS